jgi:hypothetical protein
MLRILRTSERDARFSLPVECDGARFGLSRGREGNAGWMDGCLFDGPHREVVRCGDHRRRLSAVCSPGVSEVLDYVYDGKSGQIKELQMMYAASGKSLLENDKERGR